MTRYSDRVKVSYLSQHLRLDTDGFEWVEA